MWISRDGWKTVACLFACLVSLRQVECWGGLLEGTWRG